MSAIKDVANAAGLSVSVVSKYLKNADSVRDDTRLRIESAIKQLNYIPNAAARTLRTGRTNSILVIMPGIINPYFAELFDTIRGVAQSAGYTVLLQTGDETGDISQVGDPEFSTPSIQRVDGIILCFPERDHSAVKLVSSFSPLPVSILSWHRLTGLNAGTVVLDVRDGIYQTTKHLISLGHRSFGYIGGHDWSTISGEKRHGFLQALAEEGVVFDPKLEYHGKYRMETGFDGTGDILEKGNPTAFVAENDVLAVGCVKYCLQNGISVPDQVAVTGFDDIALAAMFEPSITSARHPLELMAQAAVRYVVTGGKEESAQVFSAELVVRNSSVKSVIP